MSLDKKKLDKLSFEDALEQLESVVESMETGNVPLEELVDKFAEGQTLLEHCSKRLKKAELKIEKLKTNSTKELEAFED